MYDGSGFILDIFEYALCSFFMYFMLLKYLKLK